MDEFNYFSLMRPKRVCLCAGVGEAEILAAIERKGARDLESVMRITGACSGCGTCLPEVARVVEKALAARRHPLFPEG